MSGQFLSRLLCIGASDAAPHISYRPAIAPQLKFTLTVSPNICAGKTLPNTIVRVNITLGY